MFTGVFSVHYYSRYMKRNIPVPNKKVEWNLTLIEGISGADDEGFGVGFLSIGMVGPNFGGVGGSFGISL